MLKKGLCVMLTGLMLCSAGSALAGEVGYTKYLANGINGKVLTGFAEKTRDARYAENQVDVMSPAGVTKVYWKVWDRNSNAATDLAEYQSAGMQYKGYLNGRGTVGVDHRIRMQNETGTPSVTVQGIFRP